VIFIGGLSIAAPARCAADTKVRGAKHPAGWGISLSERRERAAVF
jgi:hypothetical protein